MKKLVVMAIALMIASFAPIQMSAKQSQDDEKTTQNKERGERKTPAQMAEERAKQMTTTYGLTEAQQKQLVTLFTEQMSGMSGQRGGRGGFRDMTEAQRDSAQKVMKAQREKFDASMKKILTSEQYTKYTQDEKARMEKMRERREKKAE